MIHTEIQSQINKSYGIEIAVRFYDDEGREEFKTFLLKDQKQIDTMFAIILQTSVDGFSEPLIIDKTGEDIVEVVKNYFEENIELTKEDFLTIIEEKTVIEPLLDSKLKVISKEVGM